MTRRASIPAMMVIAILLAGCGQSGIPRIPFTEAHVRIPAANLSNTYFGVSVAAHGAEMLVGAPGEDDISGAVYLFERNGSDWTRTARLTASDGQPMQAFGEAMAFDGDHALVSMRADATNGTSAGAAYVYERDGTGWSEHPKLTASDGAELDLFGSSLGISGSYLIIGAPGHDGGTADSNRGAAYLFELIGGTWTEVQILTLDSPADADEFGYSVAIDGTRALIGAPGDDESAAGAGAVYVFERNGTTWVEAGSLTASDAIAGDSFGWSVALAGDRAVVGAPARDDDGTSSGAAYVFDLNGNEWQQIAKLTASEPGQMDVFGHSVDLTDSFVAVGAPSLDLADVPVPGAAYVYAQVDGVWSEVARLTADDGSANERFGHDLSLAEEYIGIGVPLSEEQGLVTGAVYAFER